MILFPHAKINLGLNVLARRPDGYHDIESIMVPIPLHDVLEAVIAPELGTNGLAYTRSGLAIPGAVEHDLCYKALRALQAKQELPGLRLHLHKVVPMGAGLGGGSSDGAHTLLLVKTLCQLGLPPRTLAQGAHGLILGVQKLAVGNGPGTAPTQSAGNGPAAGPRRASCVDRTGAESSCDGVWRVGAKRA